MNKFLTENGVTASVGIGVLLVLLVFPELGYNFDDTTKVLIVLSVAAIARAIQAGAQKIAKARGLLLIPAIFALAPSTASADLGRIDLVTRTSTDGFEVSELRLAPMVIVNAIQVPLDRREEFRAGVDVGGCYAMHYAPAWWLGEFTETPFVSVGVCFESGLVVGQDTRGPEGTTFLSVGTTAVLSLMDWIAVGFGYNYRIALTDEGDDTGSPVLTLGLTAATF